ncbi:hypothetical protein SAMN05216511_0019 [Streptomyces sp. KS_16]|nr:hypothetical protein BX261_0017 [Streptomyces sp. 2321.6]SDQ61781.1 hypothetical protein SAMN05216511_0019 [Streptomyces sp. KS_16]SEB65992.1 hypothetical protein SAMN05428940_0017 [Streptomyces sp. 2133.1]SNC59286.1 hypothetical protein SAMN06272741_0019 [Streptomyces sp. 2114.4]
MNSHAEAIRPARLWLLVLAVAQAGAATLGGAAGAAQSRQGGLRLFGLPAFAVVLAVVAARTALLR